MNLTKIACITALTLCFACASTAAPVTTTSGGFEIDLSTQAVPFQADPSNLRINADFDTASVGNPFPGLLEKFDFFTDPILFQTGRYLITLGLRAAPPSTGLITLTGPDTFEAMFTANLRASFNFNGPGSGDGSGDVLGEFGNLPGFENCVNAAVSTCNVTGTFAIAGNYSTGAGGFELSNVAVAATIPEPSSLWLWASGAAGLFIFKRRRK